jgi:hypothetical protein
MIKLLEEIDEMLAAMECVAHGMEGRAITEMRGRIQTELSNSHKPVVGGPASASVSEGESLATEARDTVAAGWTCDKYCTGPWDCKCQDVLAAFYRKDAGSFNK